MYVQYSHLDTEWQYYCLWIRRHTNTWAVKTAVKGTCQTDSLHRINCAELQNCYVMLTRVFIPVSTQLHGASSDCVCVCVRASAFKCSEDWVQFPHEAEKLYTRLTEQITIWGMTVCQMQPTWHTQIQSWYRQL